MDQSTADRPWGRNNPRWTVYASGRLARLLGEAAPVTRAYVVVWVADDPSENDAQPLRDGQPPLVVNAANPVNPGQGALVAARAGVRPVRSPAYAGGGGGAGPEAAAPEPPCPDVAGNHVKPVTRRTAPLRTRR